MDDQDDAMSDMMGVADRYFPDTYLDSPIIDTHRLRYLAALALPLKDIKDQYMSRVITKLKSRLPDIDEYEIVDPDQYPMFYNTNWKGTLQRDADSAYLIAADLYKQALLSLFPFTHCIPDLKDIPHKSKHADTYFERWSLLDSLVEEVNRQFSTSGVLVASTYIPESASISATRDMVFISIEGVGKYLMTYDQLLMIKDVLLSRANVLVAAETFYYGNKELLTGILQTFEWHEECLSRHGNDGFGLLKQTEALSKAYLSQMTDLVFGDDGPYLRMMDKVKAKEIELETKTDFLTDKYDRVLRGIGDVQVVTELFGLLKVSGHPIIDPAKGGKSAAKEALSPDATFYTDACRISWEFQRQMLENHIRKKGWPHLEFTKAGEGTKLYEFSRKQFRGLNRNSYPISDWQHVRWSQIADFDYSPNYLDLIDDKSISLYRGNVASGWNIGKQMSHRRLLLELVRREEINMKQIVALIVKRVVPLDWFIVSLHPKEREFKVDARMFSMLVLEIRMFFALTEMNLADGIFPYLPQQTMTRDKTYIQKLFLQMTAPQTNTDALTMFVEIDLSRWNLRWRQLTVHMVGRVLNDMFGVTGVFDFAHEFFTQAMIVVRVNHLKPEGIEQPVPPESSLLWYNHLGGFEGICQKLWTICTYCMIALAANDLPIAIIMVGQGDNQLLSCRIMSEQSRTSKETLTALRDLLLLRIKNECEKVNQHVKPEECLESTSVVTYSKDVYVNGVYRPTSLKFHSRLFPHSSHTFPSVRTNIGAIFSTSLAGAEKSSQPLLSYYLACLHSALYLLRLSAGRGLYGGQVKLMRDAYPDRFWDWIKFCLTLPSELGGFPVVPFTGFIYKGGSDPLGKSVSAMVLSARVRSDERLYNRMLAQLSDDSIYQKEPRLRSLLADPFSIPIQKPTTSTDGVADETVRALRDRQFIRVLEIKELMSENVDSYLDQLTDVLLACEPYNPLVMRDIMDCSVAGVKETISKMFVATRTLQGVVREMGIPVVDKVLHLEARGIVYMCERFLKLPNSPAHRTTIYDLTKKLRARWHPGKESPIVGVTTYMPWDFDTDCTAEGFMRQGINAVLVAESDPINTRGPYDPYVGSKTREKRSEHGYKIVGSDSTSRDMRKLQLIASQTGSDPAFKTILDAVGWSRTNTRLSDISDSLTGISGGDFRHRYLAREGHMSAHGMGSPNFATHCVVSSDNAGSLSGGNQDYPCMLQEPLLVAQWILQFRSQKGCGERSGSVTILMTGEMMEPLPDIEVKGPKGVTVPIINFRSNSLAFLDNLALKRITGVIKHKNLPLRTDLKITRTARLHILEAYFRQTLRKNSTSRMVVDGSMSHFPGRLLDIAELVSNGLHLVILAIKNVCVDEAIVNFMMTSVFGKDRWRLDTFIMKLVPLCVSAVGPLLGHPLLRNDPAVKQYDLYDQPTYSGGLGRSSNRLSAVITSQCIRALSGVDATYNHRQQYLFSSDHERAASELLTACLVSDVYLAQIQGVISLKTVQVIIGKQLLPCLRHEHDESKRVTVIAFIADNVVRHLKQQAPELANSLSDLSNSRRVIGFRTSIEEALRLTRTLTVIGTVAVATPVVSSKLPVLRSIAPRGRSCHHKDITLEGCRGLKENGNDTMRRIKALLWRNAGRYDYGSGTATYVWAPFSKIFAKWPVILIGSGHGAVARVALDAGCPQVFGLDLRSSIPLRAHRFRSYKPLLVASSLHSEQYTQLPQSFTTTGDWTDPSISEAVMRYDAGNYTLVVDIEMGDDRPTLSLLKPIIKVKKAGLIVIRLFCTGYEAQQISSDLDSSGFVFDIYDADDINQSGSRIFVINKWTSTLVISGGCAHDYIAGEPSPRDITNYSAEDDSSSWALAVSEALFNVVDLGNSRDIRKIRKYVRSLAEDIMGDYDSRLSYSGWTLLLHACLVSEWLILPEDYLVGWLERALELGEVELVLKSKVHRIPFNWKLAHHICTRGAQLRVDLNEDSFRVE